MFSKSFPRVSDKSIYPVWDEIFLSEEEEKEVELEAREENINLMKDSIKEAKEIFKEKELKDYQTDIIRMAVALFEKRSSHVVFWKETKCKEKFNKK